MQNRVDPFGEIIETPARGSWMGNRGNIHNPGRVIIRSFRLKAWITCRLEFKGRKRAIMAPGLYTELFFLDEATAFAAGHRPCAECRREDYNKFKTAWLKGNPGYQFNSKTSIREIDEILQQERMNKDGSKKTVEESNSIIPGGTFVVVENQPYLVFNKHLYSWTPFGYTTKRKFPDDGRSAVLTPKSIVNTFRAGYIPQVNLPGTQIT